MRRVFRENGLSIVLVSLFLVFWAVEAIGELLTMRVTLTHNPKAGDKGFSRKKLTRWLEQSDYRVRYQSTRKKKFADALKDPGDLVIVAGGDGAVTKMARHLVGTGTPLAILPLFNCDLLGAA